MPWPISISLATILGNQMLFRPESLEHFLEYVCETLRGQSNPFVLTKVDQVYGWILRNEIFLPSKQSRRLSDVVLSSHLQISRTPVRQALDRLAQQGLIQFDPGRGYWTQVFTAQDVSEIYDLCEANEVLSLKLAIPRLKRSDLQIHLDTIYAMQKTLPCIDLAGFLEFDFRLHNLIINSSGNSRLARFLVTLRSQVALFLVQDMWYSPQIEIVLNDQEQFITALMVGEGEEAIKLLSRHIQNVKKGVLNKNTKVNQDDRLSKEPSYDLIQRGFHCGGNSPGTKQNETEIFRVT